MDLPAPPDLAAALAPRRVALVVGVDAYAAPALEDLRFAGSDAEQFAAFLLDPAGGRFDEVAVLAGEGVTRARVEERLGELLASLGPDDLFLYYHAGHGSLERGVETRAGERRFRDELYLYASDTDPGDLRGSAIDQDRLRQRVADSGVGMRMFVVDVCHSPAAAAVATRGGGAYWVDADPMEIWLHASLLWQPAEEGEGGGLFTQGLLDGLRTGRADLDGDGLITALEAYRYTDGWLRQRSAIGQRARINLDGSGWDPERFWLAGDPARAAEPRCAVVYGEEHLGRPAWIDGQPDARCLAPGRHDVVLEEPGGPGFSFDVVVDLGASRYVDLVQEYERAREGEPRWYDGVGAGAALGGGGGGGLAQPWPAGGVHAEGWWLPRDRQGWRPALGVLGECRAGAAAVATCGALARAGYWRGRGLVYGPVLGLGAIGARRPQGGAFDPESWALAPAASLGGRLQLEADGWAFAVWLDGRIAYFDPYRGQDAPYGKPASPWRWSVLPAFTIGRRHAR